MYVYVMYACVRFYSSIGVFFFFGQICDSVGLAKQIALHSEMVSLCVRLDKDIQDF